MFGKTVFNQNSSRLGGIFTPESSYIAPGYILSAGYRLRRNPRLFEMRITYVGF